MDKSSVTSLLVVSETRFECDALAGAVAGDLRLRVVGSAVSREEAILAVRRREHQVLLLRMGIARGLAVVRAVRAADPGARIVVAGVPQDGREIRGWSEAGVLGCVGDKASLRDLSEVIAVAARGEASCSPDVMGALFRWAAGGNNDSGGRRRPSTLTRREVEILGLVDQGLSNKEIARALNIELSTVKNHVQSIFRKLGIHRRRDAME